MQVPDATALIGQTLAGKYKVERVLGQGGMGDVFLVRHVQLDEARALKRMRPEAMSNPEAFERFRREARQQSRIRHPNVAVLYDFEEPEDGGCFLVMEYVDGTTLAALMAPPESVPLARAVSLISQTAAALDASHDEGIVHRDLKPENILVGRARDGSDRVKVVDFGVASLMENDVSRLTRTGYLVGTPRYMSPEQLIPASNAPIDGRSDIYSLGLIAVELLTGTPAFECRNMADVVRRAVQPPPRISALAPARGLPRALDEVFDHVLATERDERFGRATAFSHALISVLIDAGLLDAAPAAPGSTPWGGIPVIRATPEHARAAVATPSTTPAPPIRVARAASSPAATPSVASTPSASAVTTRSPRLWIGLVVCIASAGVFWRVSQDRAAATSLPDSAIRNAPADSARVVGLPSTRASAPPAPAAASTPPTTPPTSARAPARKDSRAPAAAAGDDRLRVLETAEAPTTSAQALQRMKEVSALLPGLRTRRDTLVAELLVIEALSELNETAAICTRLSRIEPMAKGTSFEPSVSFWRSQTECQGP